MQYLKPHVYYYDDDEIVGHYLDYLRVRDLFEATRDTAKALAESRSYFWTICCHLRYPSGKRDGVLFHGMDGHQLPEDNGLALIVVLDLDNNEAALEEMTERLRGMSNHMHIDLDTPKVPDIETEEIHWPTG